MSRLINNNEKVKRRKKHSSYKFNEYDKFLNCQPYDNNNFFPQCLKIESTGWFNLNDFSSI